MLRKAAVIMHSIKWHAFEGESVVEHLDCLFVCLSVCTKFGRCFLKTQKFLTRGVGHFAKALEFGVAHLCQEVAHQTTTLKLVRISSAGLYLEALRGPQKIAVLLRLFVANGWEATSSFFARHCCCRLIASV